MTRALATIVLLALAAGCGRRKASEPVRTVYLACELSVRGQVVARPQLLADVGVPVQVHQRGAAPYALFLQVTPAQARYQVAFQLETPHGEGRRLLTLGHDQSAEVVVDDTTGLALRLRLLRVPSPELDERLLHTPSGPERSVLSI